MARGGRAASLIGHGWEVVKECAWVVFVGFVFGVCLGDGSLAKRVA